MATGKEASYWESNRDYSIPDLYWDSPAERQYDAAYKFFLRELVFNDLRKIFNDYKIRTVLDLGCGYGLYFPLYHDLNLKVLAYDLSYNRVAVASKMVKLFNFEGIRVRKQDVLKVESFGRFDCVLMSYVLMHLEEEKVRLLIERTKNVAPYYVVIGYYSEPFESLLERHKKKCERLGVPPNRLNVEKGINSAAYDYPSLFKMPYELHQFQWDVSLLLFKGAVKK